MFVFDYHCLDAPLFENIQDLQDMSLRSSKWKETSILEHIEPMFFKCLLRDMHAFNMNPMSIIIS
jgi:hypothetical protein